MNKKQTSSRKKGLDFQRWIKEWLEDQQWKKGETVQEFNARYHRGWIVQNFPPKPKRIWDDKEKRLKWVSVSNDCFGCIDLIAKKKDRKTLFIQSTDPKSYQYKIKKMLAYVPWNHETDDVQIWVKMASGLIQIWQLNPFGKFILLGKIYYRKFEPVYDYKF